MVCVPSAVGVSFHDANAAVARTRSGTSSSCASVTERIAITSEPSANTRCVPTMHRSRELGPRARHTGRAPTQGLQRCGVHVRTRCDSVRAHVPNLVITTRFVTA